MPLTIRHDTFFCSCVCVCVFFCEPYSENWLFSMACKCLHRLCALHAQTCHTNHTFIESHQSRLTNNTKQPTAIETKTDTQMMHVLQTKVCANWTSTLYPKPWLFMAITLEQMRFVSSQHCMLGWVGMELKWYWFRWNIDKHFIFRWAPQMNRQVLLRYCSSFEILNRIF